MSPLVIEPLTGSSKIPLPPASFAIMRIRITFAKTDAMRFTSHLDLHRTWERTFRRAALPLAYSQGFNPHPRINLASALPLGFTSQNDVVDVWLEQELSLEEIQSALQRAAPPGLQIQSILVTDDRAPTLQAELLASDYVVTLLEPIPDLEQRLAALLAAPSLPRERRGKSYDLRPLIHTLQLMPPEPAGSQRFSVRLNAQEGATGRPEEVLAALGAEPEQARVHRLGLVFKS